MYNKTNQNIFSSNEQTNLFKLRHVLCYGQVFGLVGFHVDGRFEETRRADFGDGVEVPLIGHFVVLDADDASNERLELALDETNAARFAVGGGFRCTLPRGRAEQNAAYMPAGWRRGAVHEAKRHGAVARIAAQRVDRRHVINRTTVARQLQLVTKLHTTAELVVLNILMNMRHLTIIRSLHFQIFSLVLFKIKKEKKKKNAARSQEKKKKKKIRQPKNLNLIERCQLPWVIFDRFHDQRSFHIAKT